MCMYMYTHTRMHARTHTHAHTIRRCIIDFWIKRFYRKCTLQVNSDTLRTLFSRLRFTRTPDALSLFLSFFPLFLSRKVP